MPHLIVGTAGHIDHGKTSLVKALTGIDADRLKEEKERGITIDIGFANLDLGDGTTIGFVDVPGHERFIKNMLAGVGGIDVVLLVIAADESVMPQTREHLDICSLLRIKQGLTVITKVDAVEPDMVDLVELEVRDYLKGTFLERSPVMRVSSTTGQGIPELVATLQEFARSTTPKSSQEIARLPIDRCFTMKGFGTVVTGTLISGELRKDAEVEVLPSGRRARIRGIQVHGDLAEKASAGQRTALNLQAVEVSDIQRGMVLTVPDVFDSTSMLDCYLELLPSAQKIEGRKRVRFHTGTAELMGNLVLLGRETLEPGQSGFAQIRLESAAFALPGDRFIVRQYSPMITIGGGEILDSYPQKHRISDPKVVDYLSHLRGSDLSGRILLLVEHVDTMALTVAELMRRLGRPQAILSESLNALQKDNRVRRITDAPPTFVATRRFAALMDAIEKAVAQYHRDNSLVPGVSREELKSRVAGDIPGVVFFAALDELAAKRKIGMIQEFVQIYGRTISLDAGEERVRGQLEQRYLESGVQVLSQDEVIRQLQLDVAKAKRILQLLVKEGALVKINEEMLVHSRVMKELIERIRGLKATSPKLGVGEFKDLTGVSRKWAIPLLEYLDRQRVTRRMGDDRYIV